MKISDFCPGGASLTLFWDSVSLAHIQGQESYKRLCQDKTPRMV